MPFVLIRLPPIRIMSQPHSPNHSNQHVDIEHTVITDSQAGGAAGPDLGPGQGSGNIFKDMMITVLGEGATSRDSFRQTYRNRQALLNQVNHYWIDGVLATSLRHRGLVELGLDSRPNVVFSPYFGASMAETSPIPPGTRCIDVFDQMGDGRAFIISGARGAGKTTMLLTLARDLLQRAEQDIDHLLPVIFNLSSWASEQPIADWLVAELSSKYQVPQPVGAAWVERRQLLLLLDGLDELLLDDQADCIVALNQFCGTHSPELVVCICDQDYEALGDRLDVQHVLGLQPLTLSQIQHSLQGAGPELAGLNTIITTDVALQDLARSPLMLVVMAMAYGGVEVDQLSATALIGDRRRALFDTYIQRMLQRRGADLHYTQPQIMQWLIWLAQCLEQVGCTVFLIEDIQPDWITSSTQRYLYRAGVNFALLALWSSLHVGLLVGHRDNMQAFDWRLGLLGGLLGLLGAVVYGAVGGLLGSLTTPNTPLQGKVLNGLLLGAIFAPIFAWLLEPTYGMLYGVVYGIIGLLIYDPIHDIGDITPIDALAWSWQKALRYSVLGILIGLALTLGTMTPLVPGLMIGLMLSLIFGFEGSQQVGQRTRPNQRIWQSGMNAMKLLLTIGIVTGILFGVVEGPVSGMVNGLLLGLASGLMGGRAAGITCIKHGVLRLILWANQDIPWNYARFLDYAGDRMLMQKVGGGYVFTHRALLEHFAQMQPSPPRR